MLEQEKEMYTQLDSKRQIYEISKRNFLDDYANHEKLKIDMTMSGNYLYKYPKFKIKYSKLCKYPSNECEGELVQTIKTIEKVDNKAIVIGLGANGILQNVVRIFLKDGGNLVTPYLTFNQAEYATTAMKGYTKRVYMKEDANINENNIIKSIDNETKMIYICNPNNPTGILMEYKKILQIAQNASQYVVIDESAIDFTRNHKMNYESLPNNVIIIKSLSKAYGVANLRIGYMICSKEFEKIYNSTTTINEVSGIACQYAKKLLNSYNYKENIVRIIKQRNKLEKELKEIGIEFYKSESNVLFTKTKITKDILEKFYKRNIAVVSTYDQNKDLHIRIAVQDKKTNKIFIKKCKEIFKEN